MLPWVDMDTLCRCSMEYGCRTPTQWKLFSTERVWTVDTLQLGWDSIVLVEEKQHQWLHNSWFHLYTILKWQNYRDVEKGSGIQGLWWGGCAQGVFWGDGTVLRPDCSSSYTYYTCDKFSWNYIHPSKRVQVNTDKSE